MIAPARAPGKPPSGELPAPFQQRFAQAVHDDQQAFDQPDPAPPWARHPAFAVYRNTVLKGCIDALQANHPAVCNLVGEVWFQSAAALYARQHPPRDPRLYRYGVDPAVPPLFADFIADLAAANALPYLRGVARLDAAWSQCHCAADAEAADPAWLAQLPPDALGDTVLRPHPAARWHWFADQPVPSIWASSRAGTGPGDQLTWQGEGALLTRPQADVLWHPLPQAGCALLDACAGGAPLATAAQAALALDPACDLAGLLALLLRQGALTRLVPVPSPLAGATP